MYVPGDVVALARHASASSTYKPALLKALVRLCRRSSDDAFSLRTIGAEFVSLYWVQTVVFRLRQAPTIAKQPTVVRAIRETADRCGTRRLGELDAVARDALDRKMARLLTVNVLEAFHQSKPSGMPPLFTWSAGNDAVVIPAAARDFFTSQGAVLESLANLWWARMLERYNMLAPLVIDKIERDGAQRSNLSRYLDILREADGERCFYCEAAFGSERPHIDHVIPWSFLLSDPAWDLVLSCRPCNLRKSDSLPHRDYLEKLAQTGIRRANRPLRRLGVSSLLSLDELNRFYDAALGVEWPAGWAP